MDDTRPIQMRVRDLSVTYPGGVRALRHINLSVHAGETLGIVGESGCGKSTLAGVLIGDAPGAERVTGSVILRGPGGSEEGSIDLLEASEAELRAIWGRRAAMVYQDPYASLNPAYPIGDQIDEAVRRRPDLIETDVRSRTLSLLERVHMPAPERIARRYPHRISGGQQQRAVIAMALAAEPDVLLLDEPTTGLDVTTEARILDLVAELRQTVNAAIVHITHNLAVIAQIASRVAVMYAGELHEVGSVREIFHRPAGPYTAGLLSCIPRIDEGEGRRARLRTIPGSVPSPAEQLPGCSFEPRCPFADERCAREAPPLAPLGEGDHLVRCFYPERVRREGWPEPVRTRRQTMVQETPTEDGALLSAERVTKVYGRDVRRYWLAGPVVRRAVTAVSDVSFDLRKGETLGIVGESGCGKTTLVNCVAGLVPATEGCIALDGEPLAQRVRSRPKHVLQSIQMVFQNPDLSLNPQHTVAGILGRAVQVLGNGMTASERRGRVLELLERVGLSEHYLRRKPSELSGGEKQRVAVARALAGNPRVVLADEVTSALDVSVRASILNLLNDLQELEGISYLFISHDMSAVRYVSDRVMVLYLGSVMEMGTVERVFAPPFHPYTEALMSAIPIADPDVPNDRIPLEGSVPSPSERPTGCPFWTRCPRFKGPECRDVTPPWYDAGDGHYILCQWTPGELHELQASPRRLGTRSALPNGHRQP